MTIPLPEGEYAEVGPGLRMHYHSVGNGPVLLFLHGSGPGASGWSNFRSNAAVFANHGYRCILPDSLGYGLSSKPTDRPYTTAFMAGGALALMDVLGIDRFTIVGNSQGGAQAIHLAVTNGERVEKLVLMAPGGLEARERYMEMSGIRSMLRCIYGPEGITLAGMQKVFTKQVADPSNIPEGVIEARYKVALTQPRHVFETMRVDNLEERLSEVSCPTLGLWGTGDLFCPVSGAEKLATRIADCRVILFSRCGHWVMVEKSDVFNRSVLDFLQNG
jgi:4,5:9,10-diseco-3-hydroxy-5,9,17-trioxoandrosta-1(10),2-diene-4-oate hydrolase